MYLYSINIGYFILIYIAVLELSSSTVNRGINRNPSDTFQKSSDYLIIHNGRRFCEKGTILDANDRIKVDDASLKCDTVDKCSFFCQTGEKDYNVNGSRKVGRTIERVLSKTGDIIPKSSVNWLCSGDKWNYLFVKKGWITGVKGDSIRKMNPMFKFYMNTNAECGGSDLLDSAKNLSVKSSSEMCKSMKNCDFFTHTFIIDEKFMSFSTVTKFCKGQPLNLTAKDGNLLGILTEVDKEITDKGESISKDTAKPMYYYGGPITSDHYYDDLRRGSIVPATNL